jgi:hypothetical protein
MTQYLETSNKKNQTPEALEKILGKASPVKEIDFRSFKGFLLFYFIYLIGQQFGFDRATRFFPSISHYTKTPDLEPVYNEKNRAEHFAHLFDDILKQMDRLQTVDSLTTLFQLKDLELPFLEEVKISIANLKLQVEGALHENDFETAFAYFEYYQKQIKKMSPVLMRFNYKNIGGDLLFWNGYPNGLIRADLNAELAKIHIAAAEHIEELGEDSQLNSDPTSHWIKASEALREALMSSFFSSTVQPINLIEKLKYTLSKINNGQVWPEHTKAAEKIGSKLQKKLQ